MLFHNTPPRMVLHEMDIDMTCSEEAFQASSPEESWKLWNISLQTTGNCSLADAIQILASPVLDPEIEDKFSNMSILNLFAILAGMYALSKLARRQE